jgi:alpha-glucosidase (family GH31 glycosyl hydrolase)
MQTGYTWNTAQFADHVKLLTDIHEMGLATAANLHDATGVQSFEKRSESLPCTAVCHNHAPLV